ncbi:nitrogen regulatory protein P-II [Thermodesulfatator indicus DSM 15286]|uniref:Nitrogen regulatory protein P-II n=1 Tax=Thermodesulfatator indicus (strain DSM 15286 / JCM 11887 / CIR29812) TaxID=667014 RepID=F8ADN6_THEID|nr:P-II family nitrogen regulator [Thermodesulfatator indicus]AEH44921.1 nitrogen regulatory protein P-II [Thermodesulfatator indicus DSM 15286]
MKMIKAIIRPEKVDDVVEALEKEGFLAMTRIDVVGRGKQGGLTMGEIVYDELPKSMLLLVVDEEAVPKVCETIMESARTGRFGDGKIFVLPVNQVWTVRTGAPEL